MAQSALNVYDVQADYGAKGDGTTDDTAAIRGAISAISASGLLGGVLYFPPSKGGYFLKTPSGQAGSPCLAVPYGVTVVGLAGFGYFTQSKLMSPAQTVVGTNPPAGLVLVPDGSGILSNTRGYVFDGNPGRQIGAATLPPTTNNFATNVLRGANLGDWLLFSSSTVSSSNGSTQAIVNWSDDDLATAQPSDVIPSPITQANATIDPHAIMLENGHIVCAFTTQTGSGSTLQQFIQSWLSTDGGRTWTQPLNIPVQTQGGVAIQAFSEPYMIRLRQKGTGAANLLVMVFCDSDPNPTFSQRRPTVYRTAWWSEGTAAWSATTEVTPPLSTTAGCAGFIYDSTRAWLIEDGASNVQVFYSSVFPMQAPSIWQVPCNAFGGAPGTPSQIVPAVPIGQRTDTQCFGVGPSVLRLRTYEYALYYTGTNFSEGQIHFLTSPTALPGTWSNDRMIYQTAANSVPCGFGGISPVRKYQDGVELIHQFSCQPRSIFHYGV